MEDQAESSGSVEVTVKNWQDQVDGVGDKRRIRVKKTVHFGVARSIHEENCAENKEEDAVATLSLSVQLSAEDVMSLGGDGRRKHSSMSQLLGRLRRAAEVFTDQNVENEVSDDKWVNAKEKVTQKV